MMYLMHVNKGMTSSCFTENGNWKSNIPCIPKIGSKNIFVIHLNFVRRLGAIS